MKCSRNVQSRKSLLKHRNIWSLCRIDTHRKSTFSHFLNEHLSYFMKRCPLQHTFEWAWSGEHYREGTVSATLDWLIRWITSRFFSKESSPPLLCIIESSFRWKMEKLLSHCFWTEHPVLRHNDRGLEVSARNYPRNNPCIACWFSWFLSPSIGVLWWMAVRFELPKSSYISWTTQPKTSFSLVPS